jgi:transposase-like protein
MFTNLKEFIATHPDEQQCREYMEKARWGEEPFCPHCGSTRPYKLKNGKTYRCSSRKCRKDFTVTVGTIFENSNVKLSSWLTAIFLISGHRKGISSCQLARDLGVTQRTAWFINHRIRFIMGDPNPQPLDDIVEIDETAVGGKFENMNKTRRKKWQDSGKDNKVAVMGMIQRGGKAKLTVIGKSSFKEIVRQHVLPTANLMTDSHNGYIGLDKEYASHQSINHSENEYKRGNVYTNSVEGFFSLFKRVLTGTYHSVSHKHLHRYCNEVSYRFNSRKLKDKDRFEIVVSNVEGRLKYSDLTK